MSDAGAQFSVYVAAPEPWSSLARDLSARLAPLGNPVDLRATVPHATLYIASFPSNALEESLAALDQLAASEGPVAARVRGVAFADRGYVFVDLEPTPALRALHERTLELFSPLRRGVVTPKMRDPAPHLSPRERELQERHGFPWVSDLYAPHITVARLPAGREDEARALLAGETTVGLARFDSIALGECGDHGTVTRTIAERRLVGRPCVVCGKVAANRCSGCATWCCVDCGLGAIPPDLQGWNMATPYCPRCGDAWES